MPSAKIISDHSSGDEGVAKKLAASLLSLLARETSLYEELREIVNSEREILRHPSIEIIHASNLRKEACILKGELLEDARLKIVRRLASFFNEREEAVNISFLLPHLEEKQRDELRSRQKVLFAIIADIKRSNEANRNVLDSSLFHVKNSLKFINNLQGMKSGYLNSGRIRSGHRNGIMISQEA